MRNVYSVTIEGWVNDHSQTEVLYWEDERDNLTVEDVNAEIEANIKEDPAYYEEGYGLEGPIRVLDVGRVTPRP